MTTAVYEVTLDTLRDQSWALNLTDYILSIEWSAGMRNSYDAVASPAMLSATLDNSTGMFTPGLSSTDLITNGTFANWTADDPDDWTVTGEVGTDPEVSEVGSGEGHGGSGTGACNLYTSADTVSISQNILTVGQAYQITLNISTATTGVLRVKTGSDVVTPLYGVAGEKTHWFIATDTTLVIESLGAIDLTLSSVSVKAGVGMWGGMLQRGLPMRVRTTYSATTRTMFTGRLQAPRFRIGRFSEKLVTLQADDVMLSLLDAEYSPPLLQDTTVDAALDALIESGVAPLPAPFAFWVLGAEGFSVLGQTTKLFGAADHITFDTGNTTIPYVGDNSGTARGVSAQGFIRELLAAEIGGRFFYQPRTDKFVFHNRQHDLNPTPAVSLTGDDFDDYEYLTGDDLINEVAVDYQPRAVGTAGTVIWSKSDRDLQLQPAQTRSFVARYRDPANENARVGGLDVIDPVRGTDYTANSKADGSGVDRTGDLVFSAEVGGTATTVYVTNLNTSKALYITKLQVRGTPIYLYEKQTATGADAYSIALYGRQPDRRSIPLLSTEAMAESVISYLINQFKEPFDRFRSIRVIANHSDGRMTQALARTIGDAITITEAETNHASDYIIVGEQHQVRAGGDHTHETTWILKPAQRAIYWVLGATGYSELGLTTRLAF